MPLPIAQFGYTLTGLEVAFTNLSLGVDENTTYAWDFGNGNNSIDESPTETYATAEFFTVSLTATNGSDSDICTVVINLTGLPPVDLFNNIPNMVDLYSPTSIVGTIVNHAQKEFLIAKWQLYLQPLVENPSVEVTNTYIPSSWSPLANSLIAKLTVIDIIEMEVAKFTMNAAQAGSSSTFGTSSSSSNSSQSNPEPGPIKSIETGPTKVERYENKDTSSSSEMASNLAKTYQSLTVQGGILDQLKESACMEADRIDVYLPMCGVMKNIVIAPKVFKNITRKRYYE